MTHIKESANIVNVTKHDQDRSITSVSTSNNNCPTKWYALAKSTTTVTTLTSSNYNECDNNKSFLPLYFLAH